MGKDEQKISLKSFHMFNSSGQVIRWRYMFQVGKTDKGVAISSYQEGSWAVSTVWGEYIGTVETLAEAREKLNI